MPWEKLFVAQLLEAPQASVGLKRGEWWAFSFWGLCYPQREFTWTQGHWLRTKPRKDLQVHTRTRSGMPTSSMQTSLRSWVLLAACRLSSFAFLSAALPGEVGFSWAGAESCSPTLLSKAGSGKEKQPLTEALVVAPKQIPPKQSSWGKVCLPIWSCDLSRGQHTRAQPPASVNKVLLEHSHSLRQHVIYACFGATTAELSSCDRKHMACEA